MIKQTFDVEKYWKVIVYYDIDYNLFHKVTNALHEANCPNRIIDSIYDNMCYGNAKAFTYNNTKKHISVVGFNVHNTKYDYINSIAHEAEHIKQGMLKAYHVKDADEPPAYTIGFLMMKMFIVFDVLLKDN